MNSLPLYRRAIIDSWRGSLGWAAGVVAAILLYLSFYPSIGGTNSQMQSLLDSMPPAFIAALGFGAISTGAGYAQATFFALLGFVLVTIASASWGAAAIAGDEENGPLELTLAHGVTRTQLYVERAAAIGSRLVWLGLVAAVLVIAVTGPFELAIEPLNAVAAAAALVGLGFLSGSVALAVGAITGRRGYAVGAGAAVAILGYAINAIANQSPDLAGLHAASPVAWAYQNLPLANGADWAGLGLLFGSSALVLLVGLLAFQRRDVGV